MYLLLYTLHIMFIRHLIPVMSVQSFFTVIQTDGRWTRKHHFGLSFFFFLFCRKVNCLQLCAAGCADNKHDHSLSSVCSLFQKAPLVLLLHSLSDNEGDWSILPLLPQ